MVDAAPFANQHSAPGPSLRAGGVAFDRPARSSIIGHALEQAAGGRFETAERALLHTVRNRVSQQIPLHAQWRCGSVGRLPARLQFVVAEASEIGDLGGESLVINSQRYDAS